MELAKVEKKKFDAFIENFTQQKEKWSARKLRLLIIACCKSSPLLFTDPICFETLEVGEQYADQLVSKERLEGITQKIDPIVKSKPEGLLASMAIFPEESLLKTAWYVLSEVPKCVGRETFSTHWSDSPEIREHNVFEAWKNQVEKEKGILFDLFEPELQENGSLEISSFQPSEALFKIASKLYKENRFDSFAPLIAALEKEKAPHPLIEHFNRSKNHVKGCWGLDKLLRLY